MVDKGMMSIMVGSCVVQVPIDDWGEELPAYCGECGNLLELVRPGKHQCNYCEEKEDEVQ